MIKCEVIGKFTLEKFNKLKNVEKVMKRKDNEFGVGDTFECDKEMAGYLLGNNVLNKVVVKVIEVEPEIKIEQNKIELNASNITITDKDNKKINIKKKKSSKK